MRKYFLWKSSDQDKSFVEDFNSIVMKSKKAKFITLAVIIICFLVSIFTLSENSNTGQEVTVFTSPKDRAISKIKNYEELNNKIIKDLRNEDIDKAIDSSSESNKYFQEVLSQDEYLNENYNMDLITENSYYFVSVSGNALDNETDKYINNDTQLGVFLTECVGLIKKANEHMEYVLLEIEEDAS